MIMRLHIFYICILWCTTKTLAQVDQSGWIDPHDMSPVYDKEYFPYDDIEVEIKKPPVISEKCDCEESQSKAYLKRTINMILNAVHEDTFHGNKYKGHLAFEIDMDKFARLHEFTSNKFDDLHEVDLILSDILKEPPHTYLKQSFLGWCYVGLKALCSRSGIITVCALSCLYVVYKMITGRLHYWAIFKFLFVILLVFDFGFVWIRLYRKAEIDKLADSEKYRNSPNYCNPKTMSSMDVVRTFFSSKDECKEYHRITLTDIFWNVSPGDVLTEMVTKTITQPMKALGPVVGEFIYGIYGVFPFGLGLVLLPVALIYTMIMSGILLSSVLGVAIKFNFFHLVSLSFGERQPQINGHISNGHTVQQLPVTDKDSKTPTTSALPENEASTSPLSIEPVAEIKEVELGGDTEKEGCEPDVVACECKQHLRKRKRDGGAGDM